MDDTGDTTALSSGQLRAIQPVLAVSNLPETLHCWRDRLGFPVSWIWGDPPEFCQVVRGEVGIILTLNPSLAATAEGHEVLINTRNIEALYREHRQRKAEIVGPLLLTPWGSQEYTVREINGYRLRFAAPPTHPSVSKTLPSSVRIVERVPTAADYSRIAQSVGWKPVTEGVAACTLAEACCCLVAEDSADSSVIGCLVLVPLGTSDYYLKELMVHPDWQGRQVGTALLQALLRWLQVNAREGSHVRLSTDEAIAPFYQQAGFAPFFGMSCRVRKRGG